MGRILQGLGLISSRRPRWVIFGFGCVAVGCVIGVSQLEIEADLLGRFSEDNQVRKDGVWFGESFAGANYLEV